MEGTVYDHHAAFSRKGKSPAGSLWIFGPEVEGMGAMASWPPELYLFKLTWSGLLGTEEIFVYSRWATAALDDAEAVADSEESSVGVMLSHTVTSGPIPTLATMWPSHVDWTQLKVSPWDPVANALKPLRSPVVRVLTDSPTGSTGSGLPYQNAVAVTTRSLLPGRRKYNRFYLPVPVVNVTDGKGVLQSSVSTALADAVAAHIDASASASGIVYVNYNPGTDNGNPSQAAGCWGIEDVYLGHRLDTIRRRRNQAPEGRTTVTITGP